MKKVKLNDENIHKGYLILINPDNLLKTNEIKLISYPRSINLLTCSKESVL
jgi:hypothetical protein